MDRQMKWRCGFAITGVLVGLSFAIVFTVVFYNPDIAAWALASGTDAVPTRYSSLYID